ncbi:MULTISPECIES: GAP family protein [Aphanothece]|uniref:GAP family protein n=1 Tax=Aphanothece TaxID=1121 RepID=UPI003984E740
MTMPTLAAPPLPHLLGDLAAFGLAIGLSPLHIALLLLLLLGARPLERGSWFVLAWLVTTGLVVTALLTVGHGLLLTMAKGTVHRTGLDLLGAGALLALGLRELLSRSEETSPPGWTDRLEHFVALPLPLLLGVSAALQILSPDNLVLFAKAAGTLLEAGLAPGQEVAATALFALTSGLLLLAPLLALVVAGRERLLPLLQGGKAWLFARGDLLLGLVSLSLAGYLGWQGIEGLGMPL